MLGFVKASKAFICTVFVRCSHARKKNHMFRQGPFLDNIVGHDITCSGVDGPGQSGH
jgi:hypothetical protein